MEMKEGLHIIDENGFYFLDIYREDIPKLSVIEGIELTIDKWKLIRKYMEETGDIAKRGACVLCDLYPCHSCPIVVFTERDCLITIHHYDTAVEESLWEETLDMVDEIITKLDEILAKASALCNG